MTTATRELLETRIAGLHHMPTLPVVLAPLLKYLDQPLEQLNVQQVIDLISQDKSLTAQCLHMANSPIVGRWQAVDSIRGAVIALGLQRMRDIAVSCSVLSLLPKEKLSMDPIIFWEHSLGCALVSRQLAQKIKFHDASKAYLAGLLHDIGILAHLWILPQEFSQAVNVAQSRHIPLHEAEAEVLGFNHGETGRRVAERWHLTPDLVETATWHHDVTRATAHSNLVALVALSDVLCRMGGLGYGYSEERQVSMIEEPAFALLLRECPTLQTLDWARFTFEMESYMEEVHRLVTTLYRS